MHKGRLAGALCLLLALCVLWIGMKNVRRAEPGERLLATAFPVGKADALLLQEGKTAILVDTGEEKDGAYLASELARRGVDRLDLMLISHFDKDHVGSASYLLEKIPVDAVMMPDYEGERQEYWNLMSALERHPEVAVERLAESREEKLGKLELIVYPSEDPQEILAEDGEHDNNLSLVASVTYGETSFLLTGDIEKTRIHQMLDTEEDWHHDWMKLPHHGRYTKALKKLLDAVQPSVAVICCSEEEPADEKTMELLEERGIAVWDTSLHAVVASSDGQKLEVRYGD